MKNYDENFNFEFGFVKIDVEGSELNVLKSMEKNLKIFKPIISIEFGGDILEKKSILKYLSNFGYNRYFLPERHFSEKYFNGNIIINLVIRFILKAIFPLNKPLLLEYDINYILNQNFISLLTISSERSKFKIKTNEKDNKM